MNSFDLFSQFKGTIFSSLWYRLSDTITVSYAFKREKHCDRTGITGYVYSGVYQYPSNISLK